MPDEYGFDHLPQQGAIVVACIEAGCELRGLLHELPEKERKRHWRSHGKDRAARAEAQQQSVAAFAEAAAANEIYNPNDAEEATMAKAKDKSKGAGRVKRQPRSNTVLNKILKDDRDEYVLYERAHTALRKAEKAGDTKEAEKQAKIKAKNKAAHSRYWAAYEELRAKKKAAEASGTTQEPEAPAEPVEGDTPAEPVAEEPQADELPAELA